MSGALNVLLLPVLTAMLVLRLCGQTALVCLSETPTRRHNPSRNLRSERWRMRWNRLRKSRPRFSGASSVVVVQYSRNDPFHYSRTPSLLSLASVTLGDDSLRATQPVALSVYGCVYKRDHAYTVVHGGNTGIRPHVDANLLLCLTVGSLQWQLPQ